MSPDGKAIRSSIFWVITELLEPSKRWSLRGGMFSVLILFFDTKVESRKLWLEPESTRVRNNGRLSDESITVRDSGSERADTLSRTSVRAQLRSMQPSACAEEYWGLRTIFLSPRKAFQNCLRRPSMYVLWRPSTSCSPLHYDPSGHNTSIIPLWNGIVFRLPLISHPCLSD